jgi:potassium efflux system protein
VLLLGAGWLAGAAHAQTPAPTAPSVAQLEAKVKEVEALQGVEAAQKAAIVDLLRQALAQLEQARVHASDAARYREALQSAPREARAIRESLGRAEEPAPDESSLGVSDKTPVAVLEQRLAQERVTVTGLEERLAALEQEIQAQQTRPAQARNELADARAALVGLARDLAAAGAPDQLPIAAEAARLLTLARIQARTQEAASLEQESLSQPARLELAIARRDQAARDLGRARKRLELVDGLLSRVRRVVAEEAVQRAVAVEQAASEKHPLIRQLAERNAEAGAQLARLTAETERIGVAREAGAARLKQIEQEFQGARQKLEVGGLSEALGRVLIEQRNRLPDPRRGLPGLGLVTPAPGLVGERQRSLGEVGLAQVQVDEERRELLDPERVLDRLLAEPAATGLGEAERDALRGELSRLLRDRQALLQQLSAAQGAYLRDLGELEFTRERLSQVVASYREFLNEHLLWIPSASPFGREGLPALLPAAAWLLDPGHWARVLQGLRAFVLDQPARVVLAGVALGALIWARRPIRRRLQAIGQRIGKPTADRAGFTVEGLAYTVLLALPIPAVLWGVGRALQAAPETTSFQQAIAGALLLAAPFLLTATSALGLVAAEGVAVRHLGWPEPVLRLLRRQLRLIVTAGLPLILVAAALGPQASEAHRASLGRLAFVALMGVWALALQRILRLDGALMRLYFAEHPHGYLCRLRHLWYPAVVAAPLVLAGFAAAGFYYGAGQLAVRLVDTLWLFLGAVVLQSLVARFLVVARRRLALQLARERREAALAAQAAHQAAGGVGEAPAGAPESGAVDLAAIDAQTRNLLRTVILLAAPVGLWLIWADVLPALNILERVTLWYQTATVEGAERQVPVDLADLALALVLALVSAAAARNLPATLEFVLLRYSELEPGSRYAVAKTVQYLIVGTGTAVVLSTLGWSWSQVQWLVAALGVGLGFGLQEIVANFVSGLIILFERPVRVGDTVTVGELSGTVSRIRIRATTITDFDRKEIIVPNKDFITERVVNWTLSDPITRVKVRVGVAYGSDIGLAHRAILEAVRSVPQVRPDPPPQAYFVGFGESSLDFDVYAFASQLSDRLPMTHEIHLAVERGLRRHGIEIPFPQRDLRIRGLPGQGLPVAVAPADPRRAGPEPEPAPGAARP